MKLELRKHLLPLLILFLFIATTWTINHVPYLQTLLLFLGLLLGSFFLDLDHLLYWLFLRPNLEESRLAQTAFHRYDIRSLIKLLESTHKNHTSLVFHHFFFQVILAIISVFVFSSSASSFAGSFLLALNIHLIVDEIDDYRHLPLHLQDWLFAREDKQLPAKFLGYYIAFFVTTSLIFTLLLLQSKI